MSAKFSCTATNTRLLPQFGYLAFLAAILCAALTWLHRSSGVVATTTKATPEPCSHWRDPNKSRWREANLRMLEIGRCVGRKRAVLFVYEVSFDGRYIATHCLRARIHLTGRLLVCGSYAAFWSLHAVCGRIGGISRPLTSPSCAECAVQAPELSVYHISLRTKGRPSLKLPCHALSDESPHVRKFCLTRVPTMAGQNSVYLVLCWM